MDLIFLSIFTVTCILFLSLFLRKSQKQLEVEKLLKAIPGPPAYPLVGSTLPFLLIPREDRFALSAEYRKKYPGIYLIWMGPKFPMVNIERCEYAEELLKSTKQISKPNTYKLMEGLLGQGANGNVMYLVVSLSQQDFLSFISGLITSSGQHWFTHRRLLTPAFHSSILEDFSDIFAENSTILIDQLYKTGNVGKSINICPLITKTTLDIICETAMGVKINAQLQAENEYGDAIHSFGEIGLQRFVKPWLVPEFLFRLSSYAAEYDRTYNIIHNFTRKATEERRLARKALKEETLTDEKNPCLKKRKAFLDILLDCNEDENQALSDKDIEDEVNTFMFAGHDTTAMGISWALYNIGLYEDVQEKIFQEMTEIFGDDMERPATFHDLNEMKYLERVLKESLRLYPSVPRIGRVLTENFVIGDYEIPKDTIVILQLYFIHRDERYFKDPEKFDPDRFLLENMEGRHNFAFVPFAAGPRNCIGQRFALLEEKSVISTIIRNFKIKSNTKREDIKLILEMVLRPFNGLDLTFEPRIIA